MISFKERIILFLISATTCFSCASQTKRTPEKVWKRVPIKELPSVHGNLPRKYNLLKMNPSLLRKKILESGQIEVPMPFGEPENYQLRESSVMSPVLAAKYPNIKTYSGKSLNSSSTLSMERNGSRFSFMILSEKGEIFINPVNDSDTTYYIEFYKADADTTGRKPFELPSPK